MKRHVAQFLQSLDLIDLIKNNARKNVVFGSLYKLGAQWMTDRSFPQRMHLDPASVCNLDCIMCAPRLTAKSMGIMDFDLFRKIIDECALHGPRAFALCKDGEPLLNRRFLDMIAYIKEKNPRNVIAVTTNGLLLDEHRSREMLHLGVDKLTVSIRAASPEVYHEVGRRGGYETVIENVRKFLSLKAEGKYEKPYVFLQFLPLREAVAEREEFMRLWQGYDVTLDMSGLFSWGGVVHDPRMARPDFSRRYPCYELWFTPAINWNGEVSLCSYDWNRDLVIGDLRNESLTEIWKGEKMEHYRRLHLKGKAHTMPVCDKCEIWSEYPDIFFWWQKR